MKKQHDGKNGCGAKRFSGAHPFCRAFHRPSEFDFYLRLPRQLHEQFLKARRRACACLPARQRRHLFGDKHTCWCHHPNFAQCQSVLTQCRLAHEREASAPPHMAVIVCFRFSFYPHEVPPIEADPNRNGSDLLRLCLCIRFSRACPRPARALVSGAGKRTETESCFKQKRLSVS